jgi:hypothetical protein
MVSCRALRKGAEKGSMICDDEGATNVTFDERVMEVTFKNNVTLYSIINTVLFYPDDWQKNMVQNLLTMFGLSDMAGLTHFLFHDTNSMLSSPPSN